MSLRPVRLPPPSRVPLCPAVTLLGPLPTSRPPTGRPESNLRSEVPAHLSSLLSSPTGPLAGASSPTPAECLSPAPHPSSSKPSFQPGPPRRPLSPTSCSGRPAPGPRLTQHPVPSSCAPGRHCCPSQCPRHSPGLGQQLELTPGSAGPTGRGSCSHLLLLLSSQWPTVRTPHSRSSVSQRPTIRREHQDVTGISPKLGSGLPSCSPSANPRPPREDAAAVPTEDEALEQFICVSHLPGQRIRQTNAAPPSLRRN